MSDTRAAIRELRSLSEKRSTQGLSEQERSRLAELRERLGLPSEPSGPGGAAPRAVTGLTTAPVAPASPPAESAPVPVVSLPRLERPGPTALPAPPQATGEPATEHALETQSALAPATTVPDLDLQAAESTTQPELEVAPEPTATLPELEADSGEPPTDPELQAQAAPELTLAPAEPEPPADTALPELPGADAAGEPPERAAALDAATSPTEDAVPPGGSETPFAGSEGDAAELDFLSPGQPPDVPPDGPLVLDARQRPSLAERIDAAVEASEPEAAPGAEEPSWGAVPVAPEPLSPEDLGATPLDMADPASEPSFGDAGGPIELSSADVVLLEGEAGAEADLGGQPADRVPLAGLHEFIGEQPQDPRALAFDDQDEQLMAAPEDLQATGAELAAAPESFHPEAPEALPELQPEPAPPPRPPAAPRISMPRPPPGPPPPRPVAAPEPPAVPAPPRAPAPPPARARAGVPPPPPAAAFALGDDGRRVPALSTARPEAPQLKGSFAQSGPFGRPQAVLMAPAALDVMDDGESPPPEPEALPPEPAPPPATDVATGAEIFGGAYLSPTFIEGEHRVVLHTLEGQVRRGTVKDLDLLDPVIRLAQPGSPPEAIAADRVKAIFFMQEPGTAPLPSAGRRIRVGFADGRQIVGFSEDVDAGEQGFFLVPADTRTHTARIYVFRAGVQSINAA